ncbi:Fc.00g093900.m01.CDS01 [Cosmosporella sp. VM-42]
MLKRSLTNPQNLFSRLKGRLRKPPEVPSSAELPTVAHGGTQVPSPPTDGDNLDTTSTTQDFQQPVATTESSPQVVPDEATDDEDSILSETNSSTTDSAFREALRSLPKDQRKQLHGKTVSELFLQLKDSNKQHREDSLFEKGLTAITPYLKGLNVVLGVIGPLASLEPGAGTAVSLVQSVSGIAISVCGAFSSITDQICSLLERIPAIDTCSKAATCDRTPHIYNALVSVYKDLLQFHLKAVSALATSKVILHVAMGSELSDIIASFKRHADVLTELLTAEGFVTGQKQQTVQEEARLEEILRPIFRNDLQQRDDKANEWIQSHSSITSWKSSPSGPNLLVMLGDMGTGKSITTAYLVDTLSQQHSVCAYYCRDDGNTTILGNIYRTLLWQLLQRQPRLQPGFWEWFEKEKARVSANQRGPIDSEDLVEEFLSKSIRSSVIQTFVVLDGLDECSTETQEQLLSLFSSLLEGQTRLKIFISSRHDVNIEASLQSETMRSECILIEIPTSREKDGIIASYHVKKSKIPQKLQKTVIDELSQNADGSAIWVRIAVEYILNLRTQNEIGLKRALQGIPSSKQLAKLYWKLFEKTCLGLAENEERLERALGALAVALRPLTMEELSCAISIELEDEEVTSMAELDEIAQSFSLDDLIRPFISNVNAAEGNNPQVRLVHQSLKELILRAPPQNWEDEKAVRAKQTGTRRDELDGLLLQRCVKYLLFDEAGEKDRFKNLTKDFDSAWNDDFMAAFASFDDDDDGDGDDDDTEAPADTQTYKPSEIGLGNFYAYAASYWTRHLSTSSLKLRPGLSDLIKLCSKGSNYLENWVQQWCRPECTFVETSGFAHLRHKLDPLVVAAMFDPANSLISLLDCDLDAPTFQHDSWLVALRILLEKQDASAIKKWLEHEKAGKRLHDTRFFYAVGPRLRGMTIEGAALREWEGIFSRQLRDMQHDATMLADANDILCDASQRGCFILVKALFKAADKDPELKEALLADTRTRSKGADNGYMEHQSVGEAACWGHADIVRFLCEQPDIQPHLQYVNRHGLTVFHQATRWWKSTPEIFEILIQAWPEGLHIRDLNNDTALHHLCFGSDGSPFEATEVVLTKGKADATGALDNPRLAPLCLAVRRNSIALCRMLITKGDADVSFVMGIDDETRKPFLKDSVASGSLEEQDRTLRGLCRLLPIAVSAEFLE